MKIYAGIDLHSSNNYIGIIDEEDQSGLPPLTEAFEELESG
jgi:hypothetical protein